MKKQTAVEWYSEQLARIGVTEELIGHLTREAKEMEKEQIIDAILQIVGMKDDEKWVNLFKEQAEQYYNETFNKLEG